MPTYEGMFLIDNDAVRAGWAEAKAIVTDMLAKHGGTVRTARRWAERRLAYPVKGRNRATYLLCHFDIGGSAIPALTRELEIRESVLRHLLIGVVDVPEGEQELSEAELSADFEVPEPPPDVAPEPQPEPAPEPAQAPAEQAKDVEDEKKTAGEGESTPAEGGEAPEPAEGDEAPEPALASSVDTTAKTGEGKEG